MSHLIVVARLIFVSVSGVRAPVGVRAVQWCGSEESLHNYQTLHEFYRYACIITICGQRFIIIIIIINIIIIVILVTVANSLGLIYTHERFKGTLFIGTKRTLFVVEQL